MLFENERISICTYMICNGVNPILNILQTNKILLAPPSFRPHFVPTGCEFQGLQKIFYRAVLAQSVTAQIAQQKN